MPDEDFDIAVDIISLSVKVCKTSSIDHVQSQNNSPIYTSTLNQFQISIKLVMGSCVNTPSALWKLLSCGLAKAVQVLSLKEANDLLKQQS